MIQVASSTPEHGRSGMSLPRDLSLELIEPPIARPPTAGGEGEDGGGEEVALLQAFAPELRALREPGGHSTMAGGGAGRPLKEQPFGHGKRLELYARFSLPEVMDAPPGGLFGLRVLQTPGSGEEGTMLSIDVARGLVCVDGRRQASQYMCATRRWTH